MKKTRQVQSPNWGAELELTDGYVYNKESDCYVVLLKKTGKHIVMRGPVHRAIVEAYSNTLGSPATITELCRVHSIPRDVLIEYLRAFKITHSDLPYTAEQIKDGDENELAQNLVEKKKFQIVQEFNRRDWQATQTNAKKYLELEQGTFNPIMSFLQSWKPPTYTPVPFVGKQGKPSESYYLVALSDLHFGNFSDNDEIYHGTGWNINKTVACVRKYSQEIRKDVARRNEVFNGVHVCLMGDFLHSLSGYTTKGTELEGSPLGEKQFAKAFDSIYMFIKDMLSIFGSVNVFAVAGNHDYYCEWALYQCLEKAFISEPKVKFSIFTARWGTFKLAGSLFIMEHGASAFYKAKVPDGGPAKDAYIQNILLSKPNLLTNVKHRYFLSADKHSFKCVEGQGFEHIQFSTMVSGDKYADHLNLCNRPRQNVLIVDNTGVREIVNIYL